MSLDRQLFEPCQQTMGDRLRFDEPLSRHTSLRIGGAADIWAEVDTLQELEDLLAVADEAEARVTIVGLGSNTLFPDSGLRGVVVRLVGELSQWRLIPSPAGEEAQAATQEQCVYVGAGTINAHLVRGLLAEGLIGMEFLVLIPGTFGGAIAMNAGTKEQELQSILRRVDLLVPEEVTGPAGQAQRRWQRQELAAEALSMSYRHASLPHGAIVLGGTISIERGDVEAAQARVGEDKERRNRTQPYKLASVGSTFANPPGDHAGRLIEAAGLKGHAMGGARISPLHANFFINEDGDATAEDFLRLMALARFRVRRQFGVELTPEVRFVGFDGCERLREFERELEREQG